MSQNTKENNWNRRLAITALQISFGESGAEARKEALRHLNATPNELLDQRCQAVEEGAAQNQEKAANIDKSLDGMREFYRGVAKGRRDCLEEIQSVMMD